MSEDRNEIIDTDFILLTLPGEEKASILIPFSNIADCVEQKDAGLTKIYLQKVSSGEKDHKKIKVKETPEEIKQQMPEPFVVFSSDDGAYGIPVSNIACLYPDGNLTHIFIKNCAINGTMIVNESMEQARHAIEKAKRKVPRMA